MALSAMDVDVAVRWHVIDDLLQRVHPRHPGIQYRKAHVSIRCRRGRPLGGQIDDGINVGEGLLPKESTSDTNVGSQSVPRGLSG